LSIVTGIRYAAIAAFITGLLIVGTAACGSPGGQASSASAPASSSAAASADPLAGLSVTQIVRLAVADSAATSSVRVSAQVETLGVDASGHLIRLPAYTINAPSATDATCATTVTAPGGGSASFIAIGPGQDTVWQKLNMAYVRFLERTDPGDYPAGAAQTRTLLAQAGKWVLFPANGSSTEDQVINPAVAGCGIPSVVFAGLTHPSLTGPLRRVAGVTTVDGQRVVEIALVNFGHPDRLWVTDTGRPLIVRYDTVSGSSEFSDYNAPVTITAPPASEVVRAS
jgi:hypothetical protein